MRSKLATATQDFEIAMTNSLGASIPYSLRAPRNGEQNRKLCYNSRNPEHLETVCSAGVKQPWRDQKVPKKKKGIKEDQRLEIFLYQQRWTYNSVLQES